MRKSVCKSSYRRTKSHKTGKVAGPSDVTDESLKMFENESVKKLAEVADNLLQRKKMSKSWRKSDLMPIYKKKRSKIMWK